MECPNCKDVQMTQATQQLEFEDVEENTIIADVTVVWCVNCKYIHGAM